MLDNITNKNKKNKNDNRNNKNRTITASPTNVEDIIKKVEQVFHSKKK